MYLLTLNKNPFSIFYSQWVLLYVQYKSEFSFYFSLRLLKQAITLYFVFIVPRQSKNRLIFDHKIYWVWPNLVFNRFCGMISSSWYNPNWCEVYHNLLLFWDKLTEIIKQSLTYVFVGVTIQFQTIHCFRKIMITS